VSLNVRRSLWNTLYLFRGRVRPLTCRHRAYQLSRGREVPSPQVEGQPMTAPRKPSWKPDAGSSPTPSSPTPGGGAPQGWKPTAPETPGGPSWLTSRGTLIGMVVAGLLVLAIALIIIVNWPRPVRAPALVIIEAGYEENLAVPHNVAGRNAA